MAVIKVAEGVVWGSAGWELRNVLEYIEPYVLNTQIYPAVVRGQVSGVNYLDLSRHNISDIGAFVQGLKAMIDDYNRSGPAIMADPAFHEGTLARLRELLRRIEENYAISNRISGETDGMVPVIR